MMMSKMGKGGPWEELLFGRPMGGCKGPPPGMPPAPPPDPLGGPMGKGPTDGGKGFGNKGFGGKKGPNWSGPPDAKRQKTSQMTAEDLIDLVGEGSLMELGEASRQVVREAHEGGASFIEGNK